MSEDHDGPRGWKVGALLLLVLVLVGLGTWALWSPEAEESPPEGEDAAAVLARAEAFYDSRQTFERPVAYTEVPKGLPNLRAETCGSCHQAIYEEWKVSTHRRAWLDDAQFQEELAKSRGEKRPETDYDVGWLCVNCHTPLVNQLEELVVGLEDGDLSRPIMVENPYFDRRLQEDAITCAACHVKNGVVYGPYGDTNAPHPTARSETLQTVETCTRCHEAQQFYQKQNLACFFSTGTEWRESRYGDSGQTCQSCHMPEVKRKLAENFDGPERMTRRHWFGGSLIPKKPEYEEELSPLRSVYGSGVTIELLPPSEDAESAESLTLGTDEDRLPAELTEGCADDEDCMRLVVRIRNERAGHHFPAGDPERHADITARAVRDGEALAGAQLRIGSRYVWWPEIELVEDNRIPAGEHLDLVLEVPVKQAPFRVEIQASKYRMYRGAFRHHELEGRYVRGRSFHDSRWRVSASGEVELDELTDDFGTRESLRPVAESAAGQ